jgi:predicted Zn finger-like uncharacterized protein
MDVRCERCRAQYVFDDEQVTPSGLTVQCTNCGHVFKVKKKELVVTVAVKPDELEGVPLPATAAAPRQGAGPAAPSLEPERPHEPPREWRVRQANGNTFTFRELTTLQKWIIEQKVSRDDEISHSGEQWKRLGNIAELASFFQVVEAAERAKVQPGGPALTPSPMPAAPAYGVGGPATLLYPPPPSGYPPPAYAMPSVPPAPGLRTPKPPEPPGGEEVDLNEVDLNEEGLDREAMDREDRAAVKKGRAGRLALTLLLLLAAAGAAVYVFAPQLLVRPGEPEALAVPITIEVKPQAPAPPAEPPPAPVPAPEPVAERAVEPPPEPIAKPAAKPPAVPGGPQAWLAQAERLREQGRFEEALDLYGRVAGEDPENVEALTGRGLCYLDLERYPPAEASFEAALQVDPRDPDALLGLAETYRWQGKKADAIRYYERYLAAAPDGEEAQVARNALEELRK